MYMYVFMYIYTDTHTVLRSEVCVYLLYTNMYVHTHTRGCIKRMFSIIDGRRSLRRVAIHHPGHLAAVLTLQRPLPTIFTLRARCRRLRSEGKISPRQIQCHEFLLKNPHLMTHVVGVAFKSTWTRRKEWDGAFRAQPVNCWHLFATSRVEPWGKCVVVGIMLCVTVWVRMCKCVCVTFVAV